ncbi:ABC transporter ATP-binding protein [Blastochloris sulfoviridis]|uniref:ABC transporter ATP-binding protein n=1 Tax=Blastochloris sulfoviridis TaxID=50712 RepID=A0A5M6HMT1_9HYPH|nr:ABC transporter ATP-binding protein [Blastochloris sulfoviridis]KAA5597164.1 ABC transporter ATP-binding protein [Blastochloris sulfoviridis]
MKPSHKEMPAARSRGFAAIFRRVWEILEPWQRRRALGVSVLITLTALVETLSVVSIVPFISLVANPAALSKGGLLGTAYAMSGVTSERSFLLLVGFAVLAVLVLGNAFKTFTAWRIALFTNLVGHELSVRLVSAYLSQPYAFFLTRHSAEFAKSILDEVSQVTNRIIQPAMLALSRLVVTVFIGAVLVAADPLVALLVVVVLGGAYSLIFLALRGVIARSGQVRYEANQLRYHVVSEGFAGIKEIKMLGLEAVYAARFAGPSERFARTQAGNQIISLAPRHSLEAIAFGGVLGLVLYLLDTRQTLENALPVVALFAFAGYRILPGLQEIYASLTTIRFAAPTIEALHRDLTTMRPPAEPVHIAAPLPLTRAIRFEKVTFAYPNAERPALRAVELEIPRGARVGVVGPTGSGKSTLIDLLLGLIVPTEGRILADDGPLDGDETLRRWRAGIGYVPQHIFIADETVAANIAFGRPHQAIDRAAVERAARAAQLHDFIVNELPGGYDARVGERGVRLSGGQRQRLGIARALYGDPAILVLDEATSALDSATEDAVMAAIDALDRDRTIIMIAHRLRTVERCDMRVEIKKGVLSVSQQTQG